ncbi:hypothetical protein [Actinoplanes sp. NPDC049599]|uniref:hypothetical protein n=1 Tax=Actinoplanes sp. NPDC049599 TaxID=3363903 RepID=UPI00378A864A
MGASERRDLLLARQRVLRARHDELADLEGRDAEALRRAERLDPVLHDADRLMEVVDDIVAGYGRRLLLVAYVVLVLAVVPAGLVIADLLPAAALLGSLLLLAVAAGLWRTGRVLARTGS